MSLPGAHVWRCPSCGRRVPLRIEECRCGPPGPSHEQANPGRPRGSGLHAQAEPSGNGKRTLLAASGPGDCRTGVLVARAQTESNSKRHRYEYPAGPDGGFRWLGARLARRGSQSIADSPAVPHPRYGAVRNSGPANRPPARRRVCCARRCRRTCASLCRVDSGGLWTGHRVLRSDHFVLTNAHVVGDETSVRLQTGSKHHQARVVRLSPAPISLWSRSTTATPSNLH